jgi:hypothetical protein
MKNDLFGIFQHTTTTPLIYTQPLSKGTRMMMTMIASPKQASLSLSLSLGRKQTKNKTKPTTAKKHTSTATVCVCLSGKHHLTYWIITALHPTPTSLHHEGSESAAHRREAKLAGGIHNNRRRPGFVPHWRLRDEEEKGKMGKRRRRRSVHLVY